jgi:DNA polymerase-1
MLQLASEHVACKALLKYRKWSKYLSTYLLPMKYMHRDKRSRIHPTFKLFGTVTGRLSCEKPNLQNVPRDSGIRSLIGAPDGWTLIEADYSQIELRVAAMLANETRMLRAFHEGRDVHMETAIDILQKPEDAIEKEERKLAKAVNFGFLYGMGWEKFISYARDNYEVEVTEAEAKAYRAGFFRKWPRLVPWHERQRRLVNRYGRVQSPIGRVRHLQDVFSGDREVRAEAERQAINSPVQSFASDLMLMSAVRLDGRLDPRVALIVGSIHDALLFQARLEQAARIASIIEHEMLNPPLKRWFGAELTVPIEVEIKEGKYWGEKDNRLWKGGKFVEV